MKPVPTRTRDPKVGSFKLLPLPDQMQPCLPTLEQAKDSFLKPPQPRAFPLKLFKFRLLFLALGVGFLLVTMHMVWFVGEETFVPPTRLGFQPLILGDPGTLARWVAPPASLMHQMTDEELFWRASFDPQVKKYPFRRVPKIAFMFLTKGALPLYPLWERFLRGHEGLYSIYIHSPPSRWPARFPTASPFYGRQVPSQDVEWGEISMCDAERRLLANALLDISNEWFVLLSESCIPLYNFSVIYHYIMRSQYNYIGAYDDPGLYGRGRYNQSMMPEVKITQWRKGYQWFEANRKVAITIIKDVKFYPKFKEFCKPECYADEHYFPTMLSIEVPHLLANWSLTWVDWSSRGAHPRTFGKNDITEAFLRRIQRGYRCLYNNKVSPVCFLFARKFAPSALQPLLRLAPKVLGFS